MLEDDEQPRY